MPRRNGSRCAGIVDEPHIPNAEKRALQLLVVRKARKK